MNCITIIYSSSSVITVLSYYPRVRSLVQLFVDQWSLKRPLNHFSSILRERTQVKPFPSLGSCVLTMSEIIGYHCNSYYPCSRSRPWIQGFLAPAEKVSRPPLFLSSSWHVADSFVSLTTYSYNNQWIVSANQVIFTLCFPLFILLHICCSNVHSSRWAFSILLVQSTYLNHSYYHANHPLSVRQSTKE